MAISLFNMNESQRRVDCQNKKGDGRGENLDCFSIGKAYNELDFDAKEVILSSDSWNNRQSPQGLEKGKHNGIFKRINKVVSEY